jgi:hypothetical protein
MTTLLPNDGPFVSLNPLNVLTIKQKISCKIDPTLIRWEYNFNYRVNMETMTNFINQLPSIKETHL